MPEDTTTTRRSDWRSSSSTTAQQQQRRAMNRRRETAVSIRRQRKEETLQKKRGTTGIQATTASLGGDDPSTVLVASLDSYLNDDVAGGASSRQLRDSLLLFVSRQQSCDFLLQHFLQDPSKATAFLSRLLQNLQIPERREMDLEILLEISASASTKQDHTSAKYDDDSYYYGRAPPSWSDFFLQQVDPTKSNNNSVVATLLQFLIMPSASTARTEKVLNIFGNLVQSEASSSSSNLILKTILPHWSLLIRHLPSSSYCCAAILRNDATHCGMDFINQQQYGLVVVPTIITKLLLDDDTCVEAAWMVEGLSRREDKAVAVLCGTTELLQAGSSAAGTSERTLIGRLIHRLTTATATNNKGFLVPALRAIANITTACEGQYVPAFLLQPAFIETMNRLLMEPQDLVIIDAISVAGCLLTDAGIPGHPSTITAAPNFLPRLVSILVADQSRFEWKREAAYAIWNGCISLPPAAAVEASSPPANTKAQVESILHTALSQFVWSTHDDKTHQHKLMQALIDLLKSNDNDAIVPALQLIDSLVRNIESSRDVFENCRGVDHLEDATFHSDIASQLAANLIDDIFDTDDEDVVASGSFAPMVENNQFVFGSTQTPSPMAFAFDKNNNNSAPPPGGRGRGRTMPAWMQQQQQQQL